jgi:5'-nucleotidase
MHFLLTNDDGIGADGLRALEKAVRSLPGARVSIVAPAREQSQCGHRVTTRGPLRVQQLADNRFTVDGTPADCVRVALFGLEIDADVVVSGINHGGNMGQDIVISGTVAAAREAAYHGRRAIALSHYLIKDIPLDWDRIAEWSGKIIASLIARPSADDTFWNVNFPHLPPGPREMPDQVMCAPARLPLRVSFQKTGLDSSHTDFRYTAVYAERPRNPGSDVEACFSGKIAMSLLRL